MHLGPSPSPSMGLGVNQVSWSAPNTVYNFDIQAGFGYWFSPFWKLAVSYRLDAFIDPLRIAPDDGATNAGHRSRPLDGPLLSWNQGLLDRQVVMGAAASL